MAFLRKHIAFVLVFLPGIFFLIVAAALVFLATKGLDWGYVTATDVDTYAFLGVHQRILEGLASGNVKQAFTYAFYNYGYGYFLLNTLFIAPFSGFEWGWILMPRLLSVGWTIGTLWLIYRMTKRVAGPWLGIMIVSLVLSLPFFIKAAIWTHPEMMMLFFLVAMFERLLLPLDHKRFLQAALYFGLAVGVKFQAITMAPLLVIVGILWLYRFPKVQIVKTMGLSFFTMLAGYFLVNPHMLHPRGQYLFWTMLRDNILSNANNHGTGIPVTFLEKMYLVLQCYFSPISLGVFFGVAVWGILRVGHRPFGRDIWVGLWVTLVINWGILFGSVSKLWPHYYLVVAVFSVIGVLQFVFGYNHRSVNKRAAWASLPFVVLLGSQIFFLWPQWQALWHRDADLRVERQQFALAEIRDLFHPPVRALMSSGIPLNVWQWGLSYDDVQVLYGTFFLEEKSLYDVVLLNKDDVYFRPDLQSTYVDQKGLAIAITTIAAMREGAWGYRVVCDTPELLVMARRPHVRL